MADTDLNNPGASQNTEGDNVFGMRECEEALPSVIHENASTETATSSASNDLEANVGDQKPSETCVPQTPLPSKPTMTFKVRLVTETQGNYSKTFNVIMQNENGPCPLIAVANCLILQGRMHIPPSMRNGNEINESSLLNLLSNHLVEQATNSGNEESMPVLDRCLRNMTNITAGLDINIKFDKITSFKETEMPGFFDLAGVRLYHGWVVDPEDSILLAYTHDKTYDEVQASAFDDSEQGRIFKAFLDDTRSQLTVVGLQAIYENLADGDSAVFFRNNHFSTITKRHGKVFSLVTDIGYLSHNDYVYETLTGLDGDSAFFNGSFVAAGQNSNSARSLQSSNEFERGTTPERYGASSSHVMPRDHPSSSARMSPPQQSSPSPRNLPTTTTSYPDSPSHSARRSQSQSKV